MTSPSSSQFEDRMSPLSMLQSKRGKRRFNASLLNCKNVQPDQEPGSSHATSEQVCSVYQTRAVKPSASAVGIEGAFLIKMAWTASPRNRSPRSDGAFRGRASEKPPALAVGSRHSAMPLCTVYMASLRWLAPGAVAAENTGMALPRENEREI